MSEPKVQSKAGRPSRTLDEEIVAAEERLRQLRERRKVEEARERDRNQKAILGLIKAEGLDLIPAEQWKAAVPKLRTLLKVGNTATPQLGAASTPTSASSVASPAVGPASA